MRRIMAIMAVAGLAACSAEPAETEVATGDFVSANGSPAGVYEMTGSDGSVSIVTVGTDGRYWQITPDGTQGATGILEVIDGRTCARARSPGSEPLCYTETERAEDGSYTATPDGGEPIMVRPLPEASAPAMPEPEAG